jgi:hypothetical protein
MLFAEEDCHKRLPGCLHVFLSWHLLKSSVFAPSSRIIFSTAMKLGNFTRLLETENLILDAEVNYTPHGGWINPMNLGLPSLRIRKLTR